MTRLSGKTAFITGAASGFGKAMAERFSAEGADVVVADISDEAGHAVADRLNAGGGNAAYHHLDVTSEENWIESVKGAVEIFGKIDILVNNAGTGVSHDVETTTLEEYRMVNAVNSEGVFLGCKHGVLAMKETGGGSIINISSIAGIVGAPQLAAYCASKGAARMLTKSVALHCARKGYNIRCNSIHPSYADTPMVDGMIDAHRDPERYRMALEASAPLGRLGKAEDIAGAALYLASDDSLFVTGTELIVDGGMTAN